MSDSIVSCGHLFDRAYDCTDLQWKLSVFAMRKLSKFMRAHAQKFMCIKLDAKFVFVLIVERIDEVVVYIII